MKSYYNWTQATIDSGLADLPEIPEMKCLYYAYKKSEVKEFTFKRDAKEFSENYEVVYKSSPERDLLIKQREDASKIAFELWYNNLKDFWSDEIPFGLFEVCYAEAYDRGHAYGHDEVASYMHDVVSFVKKVTKTIG